MSEAKEVIIVSSDEVVGRRITSVLGLVRGNSVRARIWSAISRPWAGPWSVAESASTRSFSRRAARRR